MSTVQRLEKIEIHVLTGHIGLKVRTISYDEDGDVLGDKVSRAVINPGQPIEDIRDKNVRKVALKNINLIRPEQERYHTGEKIKEHQERTKPSIPVRRVRE